MTETIIATISPMLVMFICILIGFILRKAWVLQDNAASVLSKLVLYVFLPAAMLSSFIRYCTVASLAAEYKLILYCCAALALEIIISIPLSKVFSKAKNERNIYTYALIFCNFGFLAKAIVPQIMGEEAFYRYNLFSAPMEMLMYTWAINLLIPEGKKPAKSGWKNLLNPIVVSIFAGIALGLLGAKNWMPNFAITAMGNLGNCMGPVAMLLTGVVIGGYRVRGLLKNKKVYLVTLLRLLVLPLFLVGFLWLLGADRDILLLALFGFGSAMGLNSVVIPAAYDGDTHTGASMAMISHAGAVISIPLLYALLNWIL